MELQNRHVAKIDGVVLLHVRRGSEAEPVAGIADDRDSIPPSPSPFLSFLNILLGSKSINLVCNGRKDKFAIFGEYIFIH